jgi:hypothetical protein
MVFFQNPSLLRSKWKFHEGLYMAVNTQNKPHTLQNCSKKGIKATSANERMINKSEFVCQKVNSPNIKNRVKNQNLQHCGTPFDQSVDVAERKA